MKVESEWVMIGVDGVPEVLSGPLEAPELSSGDLEVVVNPTDGFVSVETCLDLAVVLIVDSPPRELSVTDVLAEAAKDGVDGVNVLPRELSMTDVLVEVRTDDLDLGVRYRRPELGPHRALPVKVDDCAVDRFKTPILTSSVTPSEASKTSKQKADSSRASILKLE